jgi:hypothetical protein
MIIIQIYLCYYYLCLLGPLVTTDRIYIQGRKRNNKWVFDDDEEMQYFDWAIGQPSNTPAEDILFISLTDMHNWHDGGHGIYTYILSILHCKKKLSKCIEF